MRNQRRFAEGTLLADGKRLSGALLIALALCAAAPRAAHAGAASIAAADDAAVAAYPLTMAGLKRYFAAVRFLQKLAAADPSFKAFMESDAALGEGQSDREKILQSNPKMAAILRANKVTARDYVVGGRALAAAYIVSKKLGESSAELRKAFPASDAQVAFVKAHEVELDPYMREMDAEDAP